MRISPGLGKGHCRFAGQTIQVSLLDEFLQLLRRQIPGKGTGVVVGFIGTTPVPLSTRPLIIKYGDRGSPGLVSPDLRNQFYGGPIEIESLGEEASGMIVGCATIIGSRES
jgi:hypothetical protein